MVLTRPISNFPWKCSNVQNWQQTPSSNWCFSHTWNISSGIFLAISVCFRPYGCFVFYVVRSWRGRNGADVFLWGRVNDLERFSFKVKCKHTNYHDPNQLRHLGSTQARSFRKVTYPSRDGFEHFSQATFHYCKSPKRMQTLHAAESSSSPVVMKTILTMYRSLHVKRLWSKFPPRSSFHAKRDFHRTLEPFLHYHKLFHNSG